jgi:hypothetical protein
MPTRASGSGLELAEGVSLKLFQSRRVKGFAAPNFEIPSDQSLKGSSVSQKAMIGQAARGGRNESTQQRQEDV